MKKGKSRVAAKILLTLAVLTAMTSAVNAARVHTVVPGDSMWKIAVKYQQGLDEIIAMNDHIKNPALIYPGDKINIPDPSSYNSLEEEVVRLVNIERGKQGLGSLKMNWELARVARLKSEDMAIKRYFDHQSPTYGSPFDMMKSFGIKYLNAGENIAKGQKTAADVMKGWMNSPGHKANILNANYTEIGVGVAKDSSGTIYWTQQFIRPAK
jgi:uncharacterized YkwD family protein/spore coat assembly protein SafA